MQTYIRFTCHIILLFASAFFDTLNAQWQQQPFPTSQNLWKVRFADSLDGWVLSDSAIYHTDDGGATWAVMDTTSHFGTALSVINRNVVYYSSTKIRPKPYSRRLRQTTDGGHTWQTADTSFYHYFDIEFATDQIGFAACGDIENKPAFRKTTDGGAAWRTVDYAFNPANFEISAISFVDHMRGWAVTYDAFIFNTTDGGETWALQDSIRTISSSFIPLRDIFFATPDSGWAVGGLGGFTLLAKTIDGGKTWTTDTWQGSSGREISFLNSQIGWIVAASLAPPHFWKTTDGGKFWEIQEYMPAFNTGIESISMVNENLGWAVGSFPGRLYKFDAGNPTAVAERRNFPEQFTLSTNFPNPFNPTTTIEYTLSIPAEIRLTIYDQSGKEVAVIDKGHRQAGAHKVTWDGRNINGVQVASGVYFYKLQAGHIVLTRKLALVR